MVSSAASLVSTGILNLSSKIPDQGILFYCIGGFTMFLIIFLIFGINEPKFLKSKEKITIMGLIRMFLKLAKKNMAISIGTLGFTCCKIFAVSTA